ncbi:hypothetical protein P3T33_003898 [Rhizobium sp. AN67]|nr:hypothetical protein [Rhizobium sp. AN67]
MKHENIAITITITDIEVVVHAERTTHMLPG